MCRAVYSGHVPRARDTTLLPRPLGMELRSWRFLAGRQSWAFFEARASLAPESPSGSRHRTQTRLGQRFKSSEASLRDRTRPPRPCPPLDFCPLQGSLYNSLGFPGPGRLASMLRTGPVRPPSPRERAFSGTPSDCPTDPSVRSVRFSPPSLPD